MKQIVERKLNEVRARLRALPKAYTPPKSTADRQKLLVAITQQVGAAHYGIYSLYWVHIALVFQAIFDIFSAFYW